jgi:hypothetical protein
MTNFSQFIWWHICKTAQAHAKAKFYKRATKPTHQNRHEMTTNKYDRKEGRRHNIGFAKSWISCFYESEVLNSSFPEKSGQVVHLMKFSAKNPRLRKVAKR